MYTRSYFRDENALAVPENYDGNALRDDVESTKAELISEKDLPESKIDKDEESIEAATVPKLGNSFLGGIFKKIPIPSFLSGLDIFKNGTFELGSEEILIIGIALFLLFSRGGDKECAIMLLLLLLVK